MNIYLMQHGKSKSKEDDPERGLTSEGEGEIRIAGTAIEKMGVKFDLILTSTKKRAQQTAKIIAEKTLYKKEEIEVTETLDPLAESEKAIAFIKSFEGKNSILLAGHLPSLGEIASDLLAGKSRIAIHFENGALCRIDIEALEAGEGELRYYLPMYQLELISKL